MDREKTIKIDIDELSELSMLSFTENEKKMLENEMNEFWKLASKLDEIELLDVDETEHVLSKYNAFRSDEVKASFKREEMLSLAASKNEEFITVPRVVEASE